MKRLCACVLCTVLLFSLSACYGTTRSVVTTEPPTTVVSPMVSNFLFDAWEGDVYSVIGVKNPTTEIVIPSEHNGQPVTRIGLNAFCNQSQINRVIIPNSVTHIDTSAFKGCSGLTTIVLPKSITYIGRYAFAESKNLATVYYEGSKEEWDAIYIDQHENNPLLLANRYYYSEINPALPWVDFRYLYWHYVDGVPTPW